MKLRTSVQLNAVFPILLAVGVATGIWMRAATIDRARGGLGVADEVTERVADLTLAAAPILGGNEMSGVKRLRSSCDGLLTFAQQIEAQGGDAADFAQHVSTRVVTLRLSVDQLSAMPLDSLVDSPDQKAERVRLVSAVRENLRALAVASGRAFRSLEDNVAGIEDLADRIFVGCIGIAALIMATVTVKASRNVIQRLRSLKEVCDRVRESGFQHRLAIEAGEELEASYGAFNDMLASMQKSFNAMRDERDSWKAEVEKSRLASETGKQANMRLADALARLKRAQDEIVMQERVRALEQIAVGVTRDFDDMLAPVVSMTDFLLAYPSHLEDRNEVVPAVKEINRVAKDANRRIRLLAEIFRSPGKSVSQAVELTNVITLAIQMSERTLKALANERRVGLSVDTDIGQVGAVEGDEVDFVEALSAMMVNAAEAMVKGGVIRIRAREEGGNVIVEVVDSGEGMTEEVRHRCLEPFFSTKGGGHRGMGLTTVVAALGRHGGRVSISSAPGAGSVVTVTLVRHGGNAVAAPGIALPAKLRVLAVDDEDWARRLLARILTAEKFEVVTAARGSDALCKLEDREFDMVILDRAMPEMTGDEVAVRIRAKKPGIPIVLVTGLGDVMKQSGEKLEGVDVVLSKPFSIDELKIAMGQALQIRKGVRGPAEAGKTRPVP